MYPDLYTENVTGKIRKGIEIIVYQNYSNKLIHCLHGLYTGWLSGHRKLQVPAEGLQGSLLHRGTPLALSRAAALPAHAALCVCSWALHPGVTPKWVALPAIRVLSLGLMIQLPDLWRTSLKQFGCWIQHKTFSLHYQRSCSLSCNVYCEKLHGISADSSCGPKCYQLKCGRATWELN